MGNPRKNWKRYWKRFQSLCNFNIKPKRWSFQVEFAFLYQNSCFALTFAAILCKITMEKLQFGIRICFLHSNTRDYVSVLSYRAVSPNKNSSDKPKTEQPWETINISAFIRFIFGMIRLSENLSSGLGDFTSTVL